MRLRDTFRHCVFWRKLIPCGPSRKLRAGESVHSVPWMQLLHLHWKKSLENKPAPAYDVAGFIASYFVERYQLSNNCLVIQWSGDNPNSLASIVNFVVFYYCG
ncbi:xylulose kinase-like [Chenopodium quinoa]|uniref:xylulose kinase-like n=1 Tax=Chenopodium quinoa TaxID=63459 RepID=UPI000B7812F0|nr:xylulose kinase-like [Chenopodium quinoa]XP_021713438.1 xylulose kinase-like [Chenopodium quinoa]XP_021713439.1 xylulose kinase-like [Chenopodium quinoa]XP_021713440.1 xylulose kinase-like [Chenopodium quinoa]